MKKRYMGFLVLILIIFVLGVAVWPIYLGAPNALKHDTNRWAVIEDVNGDKMAIEPTNDYVWAELVQLNQNGTRMWVGGIVESYDSKWGFRFEPSSVNVAQFTAEGLQSTIGYISANIDYWLNLGWAYVWSEIVEVHSQP